MTTEQPEKKPYATTRAAAALSLLSVLAPLSGLIVEMMLAWRYGASATVDAYRIAALLVVVGAQLFFGNLLPHVVVPMFAEYRARGMEQEGWRLAFSLTAILSAILLAFITWMWMYPDPLVGLLGPGLSAAGRDEAALLLRCFSLVLLLMAWAGMASGILYVQRVFWLSALAQIVPNLCVMLAVALAGGVEALALGVLSGYAAMLILFIYGLSHAGRRAQVAWSACLKPVSRAGLGKAWQLAWPLLAGILIGQWSVVVINRALSGLPPGTLAEFGYAWKLLALVGLLPAGLATVIFPAFSDAHANGNAAEFSRLAERALRMTLLLTLPLAVVLFVERMPVIGLLFGRGSMSLQALGETGKLFGILLVAAPASALAVALNKIAFAMHDTKSPTVVALLSALAITLLVVPIAQAHGAVGIVWVISLVSLAATALQAAYLILRYRIILMGGFVRYLAVLIVLCEGVALAVMAVHMLFAQWATSPALVELALAGIITAGCAFWLSQLLGISEAAELWNYVKWQVRQLPFAGKVRSSV